jgi:hypothetical protein
VVAIYGLLAALAIGLWQPPALLVALGLAGLLLWLNLDLYRFFYRQRGLWFALRVIPSHWLYYFYNALAFGGGLLLHWQSRLKPRVHAPPEPLTEGVEPDGR